MRIRKNIDQLTPEELEKLRRAHKLMMSRIDNRSYQYVANIHGWIDEFCKHPREWDDMGREVHLFLSWHRAYMLNFEVLLQRAIGDDTIGLPWWNWRSTEGIPTAYSSENVDGQPNPLYKFHMNFRGRTRDGQDVEVNQDTERRVGEAFSIAYIRERAQNTGVDIPDLYRMNDFRQFSEGLRSWWHNAIHGYVGGDMSDPNLAAYDPIFYPHHCNIDRIWAIWQVRNGVDNMPSHMKDIVLRPFGMTVRQVLDINALEYEYASSVIG
jgi:tyrosinase